jgi:hypothetical protein
VRWIPVALAGLAAGVVGIAGWQIWETEQLKNPKWIDTDRADCQTWDPFPQRNETVTWTGDCRAGKAEGDGTLTWRYTDPAGNALTEVSTGRLTSGKINGQATSTMPDGNRYEGMYRDGEKSGHGVYTWPDSRYDGEWKHDMPEGIGIYTEADGTEHAGNWKQGCLDDNGDVFALMNEMDECKKVLKR